MKTLIVYYSLDGNTDYAAQRIAKKIKADLLRLETVKPYRRGMGKFLSGGRSAMRKEKPALQKYDVDLNQYDRIVLGFPVWASNVAPPMRTFVTENRARLRRKELAVFLCQGGRGAEKALEKLKRTIGVASFDLEAVFIAPKKKHSKETDNMIDAFAKVLAEREKEAEAETVRQEKKLLKKAATEAAEAVAGRFMPAEAAHIAAKVAGVAADAALTAGKKAGKTAGSAAGSVGRTAGSAVASAGLAAGRAAGNAVQAAADGALDLVENRPTKEDVRGFFSHWNYKKHAKLCTGAYLAMFAIDMTIGYVICKTVLDKIDEKQGL